MKQRSNCKQTSYCSIVGIDVSLFSKDVREAMEEEMKKNITDRVLAVHPYKLPTKEEYEEKGRCKTRVKDPSKKDGRSTVWAASEEEMVQKLYRHYFGSVRKEPTVSELFDRAAEEFVAYGKVREKTVKDYRFEFNHFFACDPIANAPIGSISISDTARFLDRAHTRVSKLDAKRGMRVIEKHRHDIIRTIWNMIYTYANTYEELNVPNPIVNLDYSAFPFYDQDKLDKDWWDENDRAALGAAFDSIELPNREDLCAGFLIETAARNSECRAIRFRDFHFEAEVPYVRICGMAEKSHRDERIKADSYAGMRNPVITPRLERIYKLARLSSWSDEFPFVREPEKVAGTEILITSQGLQRALKRLCERAGVKYLPPHQIRFSDATLMAIAGEGEFAIMGWLGHTTPKMSSHYIRKAARLAPVTGPKWTQKSQAVQGIEKAPTTQVEAFSKQCPEPESNQ